MICGGDPLSCRAGPTMQSQRAGHAAFTLDQGVFLWGGSINNDSDRFQLEHLNNGVWEKLNVKAMNDGRNRFFAACTTYLSVREMCASGLFRGPTGAFLDRPPPLPNGTQEAAGAVLVYSAIDGGAQGGIATGTPNMSLTSGRFFASAAPLPGGTRAIVVGGFTDLAFTPSDDLELYDQSTLTTIQLGVGGVPRTLREARGGLAAVANGDGTVVITGGEAGASAANRAPVSTTEIFADPQTPVGVAQ